MCGIDLCVALLSFVWLRVGAAEKGGNRKGDDGERRACSMLALAVPSLSLSPSLLHSFLEMCAKLSHT